MEWKQIKNETDIVKLMDSLNYFHDSCITGLTYSSSTYVDETDLSMVMGTNPVVKLIIQRQADSLTTLEFCLEGVTHLCIHNDSNTSSEIQEANLCYKNGNFHWNVDDEMTSFKCKKVSWREIQRK
ncbi:hypothetical protein P3Q42_000664 [Listeria innocua]|uniref:hypothetical protein n=1 Tax=Listeria innocua TaxID=1642 RepID=UPI0001EBB1A6|nr:hypothetical protein [Listeria innocua]EFR90810.1 conserved hypothetical protein [Listeria innocua FSL S4-378]EAH4448590.1 hypothetical protein [Listeria innocua]EDO1201616.1 hypothetical protein [Listeria innocua]EKO3230959.1 hypothetical protein [Listeria innocua]EKQ5084590.1 hypothetical protein [Listeria innocua]